MDRITQLVEDNMGLAYYVGKKFLYCMEYDEAIANASLGLVKAAKSFNEELGTTFATYASMCMTNEILMVLRKQSRRLLSLSLDAPMNTDAGDGTFVEMLEDPTCLEDDVVDHEMACTVLRILPTFTKVEQEVIKLWLLHGQKQSDIATTLSLSQSYVSRLEAVCTKKLRKKLQCV